MTVSSYLQAGKACLGIEFGSTNIKAVLLGEGASILASGSFQWENQLVDGVWTYRFEDVKRGLAACYASLKEEVRRSYGVCLQSVASIGISAMMHGYIALDEANVPLVPFRTWRNTMTEAAANELSELFSFHIPQRWSVAHLYQAMLNGEEHLPRLRRLSTLAGYVHFLLTGEFVLGIGDASGMFPIDHATNDYDAAKCALFDEKLRQYGLPYTLRDILPRVAVAGEEAGRLTAQGALLLDSTGDLRPGIPFCPPEGDAGTGMVATNSVRARTGNVSAGTSIFAMLVLDKPLSRPYEEIDMVATPSGAPVAMVHCNNCTSDINAWAEIMGAFAKELGTTMTRSDVLSLLCEAAEKGEADCGGVLACNYYSGEHITGFQEGRPLLARTPDAHLTLGNFARSHVYATIATLRIGMEILQRENVRMEHLLGHGGFFRSAFVQSAMAAALEVPVSVLSTAAEGGAWGMAVLASYSCLHGSRTLEDYLDEELFASCEVKTVTPDAETAQGFARYLARYRDLLEVERAAVRAL